MNLSPPLYSPKSRDCAISIILEHSRRYSALRLVTGVHGASPDRCHCSASTAHCHLLYMYPFSPFSVSVTFWSGSGSRSGSDPYGSGFGSCSFRQWPSGFKTPTQKFFSMFSTYYFLKVHYCTVLVHHPSKVKSQKEVIKQGRFFLLFLLDDGRIRIWIRTNKSVLLTYGSGSGSGRPNIRKSNFPVKLFGENKLKESRSLPIKSTFATNPVFQIRYSRCTAPDFLF
jgi:hypothetical protein